MRIEIGHILRTNYDTGPYRVLSVTRGCTCTHVLDEIEFIERPLPPHMHIHLYDLRLGFEGDAWLGYYDEATLQAYGPGGVFNGDKILPSEIVEPVQASLV